MQGKHLTQKERFYIEKRRGEGVNQATIARELDMPRSTISRELRRNTDPTFNGVYCCRRADKSNGDLGTYIIGADTTCTSTLIKAVTA
ncbi:helix-turn-helix domain-containing protein [Symbiopectobacterium purcellii]|uniref:Helix-turn-helix domain-containing protein n=1 Tax=Symbiopectobacterium purcellii TaxID=2871826 RepID=A0ABX9ARR5_9ENTR|nr:helix-turn-helix domain-containing protein [Symbiopectobacterium purcellii]QZN97914.1 helix-turn-helix domain-containing protein [Symbiopectobacterium purcellii]QZN97915.1 helix-turn-helix domain-containing protein [Symbiopectobacterium purcellii]QZN97921.1 helix-turn-helix domain-containing protein [Symbiopectobacterium purcellii]